MKHVSIMEKSIFIAIIIAIAAVLWILSGNMPDNSAPESVKQSEQQASEPTEQPSSATIPEVRVRDLTAQVMDDYIEVTGRTQASRQVIVRAETTGAIKTLNVQKGDRVTAGQVIAKLGVKDRSAQLEEARQRFKQREIQYKASKELAEKGYNSRVRLAEKKAELEAARAQVKQAQEEITSIYIKAPFNGIVNQQMVEIGDYVRNGDEIVEIVDLNPIEVSGFLTEKQLNQVQEGDNIDAKLLSNQLINGTVTFIAAAADQQTRTFEMEMTVANNDMSIKEGLTAKILVPFKENNAYKVSPSILSLTDDGRVGVKIVNTQNIVEFIPVTLLKDTTDYLWITGLPNPVRIITVGQEFISAGQEVKPIISNDEGGLL